LALQLLAPRLLPQVLQSGEFISGVATGRLGVVVGDGFDGILGELILYEYVPQPLTSALPTAAMIFCSPVDVVLEEYSIQ